VILSDGEIRQALTTGQIEIDPPPGEELYNSTSLDLYLGDEMYQLKTAEELALDEPSGVERGLIINPSDVHIGDLLARYGKPLLKDRDGSFLVPSRHFVLGNTLEQVTLPIGAKIAARVEGRSTLARLGLAVHITAPTIHAGFSGNIVLEMYNFSDAMLRLEPGKLHICQLIFERVGETPEKGASRTYQGQRGPTQSRAGS
jgi:dCTP deaminase